LIVISLALFFTKDDGHFFPLNNSFIDGKQYRNDLAQNKRLARLPLGIWNLMRFRSWRRLRKGVGRLLQTSSFLSSFFKLMKEDRDDRGRGCWEAAKQSFQ
jgi:hypothetical protein